MNGFALLSRLLKKCLVGPESGFVNFVKPGTREADGVLAIGEMSPALQRADSNFPMLLGSDLDRGRLEPMIATRRHRHMAGLVAPHQ